MRKRGGEQLSVIDEDHESRSSNNRRGAANRSSGVEEQLEAAAQSERKHLLQLAKAGENVFKNENDDNENRNKHRVG